MRFVISTVLIISLLFFPGCKGGGNADNLSEADIDSLFLDGRLRADEGYDKLTLFVQFKEGGPTGSAVGLHDAASISLDGEPLKEDSTGRGDAYYEIHKPIEAFTGKHTLVYKRGYGKPASLDFTFSPLRLVTVLPAGIRRKELNIQLDGVQQGDLVRLIMVDTSFLGDGINRVDTLMGPSLMIRAEELKKLASGPVQMELIREQSIPVNPADPSRGRLAIVYSLKRTFQLID